MILEKMLTENQQTSQLKRFSNIMEKMVECDLDNSEQEISAIDKEMEIISAEAKTKMELNLFK